MIGTNNKEEIKRLREKISQKPCEIDEILKEEALRKSNPTSSSRKKAKVSVKK